LTTAAASKLEEKPIKKQNKKKKKLSFADDHGQPLFTGELYFHASYKSSGAERQSLCTASAQLAEPLLR